MMYAYTHDTSNSKLKKTTRIWVDVLLAILLFCTFFSFYMPFMKGEEFMDELDVFIIGNEVALYSRRFGASNRREQHVAVSYELLGSYSVEYCSGVNL